MTSLIASTLIMLALPYILPGITVSGIGAAIAAAIVLGIANALIKPILQVLAFPVTLITFGLFALVINGAMLMLTSALVPGFWVSGWWDAILAAIVVSLANSFLLKRDQKR